MLSIFKGERRTLFSERASLTSSVGRLAWRLRSRGDQEVFIENKTAIAALGGESGIEMRTRTECAGKTFSYLRGNFSLTPAECEGDVRFCLQVGLERAPGVLVLIGLYDDPNFVGEVANVSQPVRSTDGTELVELAINFRELPARQTPMHGFFQICLPTVAGATVSVGQAFALPAVENPNYKRLRIRFDAFGDETKASSRLRVWKFVELLRQEGHDVGVGGDKADVDVYFCQKVRRFNTLAAVRKANPRAVVVYDFDDNFVLEEGGIIPEFLAFISHVDVITCGSEYLAHAVRPWHQNVYVLENPLDVQRESLCRARRGKLQKIGWFGAPEGLGELTKTDVRDAVTTLTKGGDIEFDLQTVDQELTDFDLLLFPVEETPWNLAKNANRMMKALALGVPVLASPTPEQKRIAELTGLSEECLVPSFDGWKKGIERLRASFTEIEEATLEARDKLWHTHSTRTVLTALFNHLLTTTRLDHGLAKPKKATSSAFGRIATFVVDGSADGRAAATFDNSLVNWADFHSVHVFSAKKLQNQAFHLSQNNVGVSSGNYLSMFKDADRILDECQAEYLLVVPAGVALSYGIAGALERVMDRQLVALFVRSEFYRPALIGDFGAHPLRDLLLNPVPLGPLLVKMDWVRERTIRWQQTYELWPWVAVVKALAADTPFALVEWPFAYESVERVELSVPVQYSAWLSEHRPAAARELPDLSNQWNRMLTDVIADAALDVSGELPSIVAHLYTRHFATRRKLASVEKELRALKAKRPTTK